MTQLHCHTAEAGRTRIGSVGARSRDHPRTAIDDSLVIESGGHFSSSYQIDGFSYALTSICDDTLGATSHIVLIGTGMTSLTIARSLLLSTSISAPFSLTLLDKAKNPGGRLTSRTYESGVVLETGARVFESSPTSAQTPGNAFAQEVEGWESKGYVKHVASKMLKGVEKSSQGRPGQNGKWWEGVGGFSKGLIAGLVQEIKEASKGRVEFKYEVTAANPTPVDPATNSLELTLEPTQDLSPISYLVHTAPSPQTSALLPSSASAKASPTTCLKTFVWLLPTIKLPHGSPIYHRDPHPSINSIATGLSPSHTSSENDDGDDAQGLVIQSTPEKPGLGYTQDETTDQAIRDRLFQLLCSEQLLPLEILSDMKHKKGRESQIKRWKFAQVENAVEVRQGGYEKQGERCIVLPGGKVILAGDGTVGGAGGVEGAFLAGLEAAELLTKWLEQGEDKSQM